MTSVTLKVVIVLIGLAAIGIALQGRPGEAEGDPEAGDTEPVPKVAGRDNPVLPDRVKACPEAGEAPGYATYQLGGAFERMPRTDTSRPCQATKRVKLARANFVEHIYGDCDPKGESCAFPLAVQNYPACERARGDYQSPSGPFPGET